MPIKYAILIDAGFIKRKLGSQESPVTSDELVEFVDKIKKHPVTIGMVLHRVYYYDAPPLTETVSQPLTGKRINFSSTELARNNQRLLQKLAHAPYFALRLGEVVFRGWKVNQKFLKNANNDSVYLTQEHLSPNVQQKGVDMRIGLDIASLTLKKQVSVIVLVTGDSDFIPAMKFARREGAQLFLVHFDHHVKDTLIDHADIVLTV